MGLVLCLVGIEMDGWMDIKIRSTSMSLSETQ
jgi:hypothetical protein